MQTFSVEIKGDHNIPIKELEELKYKTQKPKTNSAVELEGVNSGHLEIKYNTLTFILWKVTEKV